MSVHDTKLRGVRAHGRFVALVLLLALSGCQQQMASQPSYHPLEASTFFADGQASRPTVKGTVARGHLELDWHLYTGRIPGANAKAEASRTETPKPTGQNVGANKADFDRGIRLNVQYTPTIVVVTKNNYQMICGAHDGNDPSKILPVAEAALAQAKAAPASRAKHP